ncbi:TonB-linked SusC/RagA family outer membrane protein [Pedobacter cryoconitis]|uniref:TonB-linked SusC/RagA family outer membrane protein n=1 Tax=Pedobacter cryoconitis TaxID=188932 RepID=A0A7W8ZJF6_9SPHI|nr:SusC/RagA family TonB-linked outer membrane protein [Pedobacter cryoconitis]MBB5635012.1 TonB-linked SusC/RagA family outer membrane protein [Pedobacter cryoconitis]MBB6271804.1 TonB-linked SusC/RagA family outer membrane protein [Pedobacter cryoconitis]
MKTLLIPTIIKSVFRKIYKGIFSAHQSIIAIACMIMFLNPANVFAQTVLTGTVTSSKGEILTGVNIHVIGTKTGTTSDSTGNYKLMLPAKENMINFSLIGYKTQQLKPGSSPVFNVILDPAGHVLTEVVITSGLATSIKRSNAANAIVSLSAARLTGTTTPSTVDAAFSGKIVGATITQMSGAPGGGVSMQLRGISSITSSSQPLFIMDGVILNNSSFDAGRGTNAFTGANSISKGQDNLANRLADINAADIESVEVLKGSSAAAIYGTLANAGVVIITTKKGFNGPTKINFTQDIAAISATKLLPYGSWDEDKIKAFYSDPAQQASEIAAYQQAKSAGQIYNYPKEIYGRTALGTYSQLGLSGGSENTRFYISGGYNHEDGLTKNTGFKRATVRANINHNVNDRWDVQFNSNYINNVTDRGWENNDNNGVDIGTNLTSLPSYAQIHRLADGTYPVNPYYAENPFHVIDAFINRETTNRFIESFTTNYSIVKNDHHQLKASFQGGLDYLLTEAKLYAPDDAQSQINAISGYPGASRFTNDRSINTNFQLALVNTLEGKDFTNKTSAGLVRFNQNLVVNAVQGEGLEMGQMNPVNAAVRSNYSYSQQIINTGAFLQHELNWKDRVIATAALRIDKNTTNTSYNSFYPFPKGAVAVNLTKFDFWKTDAINQLKLRAAYGQTGGPAAFGSNFSQLNPTVYNNNLGLTAPITIGNDKIKYEIASEIEYGADMGFFNNAITLEVTLYDKKVKNLLQPFTLAPSVGYSGITGYPIGDLQNKGLEISLGATPVNRPDFRWNTILNYWFNRSKITRLIIPPSAAGPNLGALYGFNELRVGQSPTEFVGTPLKPDGTLTKYGDAQPKFQMTSYNKIDFLKHFEFSFLLHWNFRSYVSNFTRFQLDQGGQSPDWMVPTHLDGSGNIMPGPAIPTGLARQIGLNAGYFIESASYLKLREAALNYSFSKEHLQRLFGNAVKGLKVGVSGNNLFTITKYTGLDPEVSAFGQTSVGSNYDIVSAPYTKRFLFHLGVEF